MTSPPESSRARLLKLRRVQFEFGSRNRQRELRWLLPGGLETAASGLSLQAPASCGCGPANDSDVISIAIQLASSTLGLLA
jgi:hypothetical protein